MASEQLKTVYELLDGANLGGLTLQERREFMAAAAAPPPAGTTVDSVDADGVPGEWVTAAGVTGQRAVLFFPGGAYHIGTVATLRRVAALVSDAAQARVLSVGYRLAPEHPFPAAVHDALAAYRWLLARGPAARQIAIAGNSSGGGWRSPRSWPCATPASPCPRPPWSSRRGRTWRRRRASRGGRGPRPTG